MAVCHFNKGWQKISKLKTRIKPSKSNPFLKQIYVISTSRSTPKKFVPAPIDKASNSVAIICKQYYIEVILNKIGVLGYGKSPENLLQN